MAITNNEAFGAIPKPEKKSKEKIRTILAKLKINTRAFVRGLEDPIYNEDYGKEYSDLEDFDPRRPKP